MPPAGLGLPVAAEAAVAVGVDSVEDMEPMDTTKNVQ